MTAYFQGIQLREHEIRPVHFHLYQCRQIMLEAFKNVCIMTFRLSSFRGIQRIPCSQVPPWNYLCPTLEVTHIPRILDAEELLRFLSKVVLAEQGWSEIVQCS